MTDKNITWKIQMMAHHMENLEGDTERHHMENPVDGTERHNFPALQELELYLTSLLCGSWSFTLPVTLFAGVQFFSRENSFKCSIQVCLPQCTATINCKFFMMASIEGIYHLLIVSYVLASGSDLVTPF